MHVAMNEVVH